MKTREELIKVLKKESIKFNQNAGYKLSTVFDILEKNGISSKSKYSLPHKDTIGKVYFEQVQFLIY
jgi:hypothetical protein